MRLGAQSAALAGIVLARARRRPGRWLLTAGGLAPATAFGGTVVAEATIAADRSAHAALGALFPQDRVIRITSRRPSSAARALLRGLVTGPQTEAVLLGPVGLDGVVLRPAGIEPLQRFSDRGGPGACLASSCPMLLAGGNLSGSRVAASRSGPWLTLTAPGVRVQILGRVRLRSAVPLGFVAGGAPGEPPLILTGDAAGLERLGGLSGIYRTHSWLAPLPGAALHSWQLAGVQRRLQRGQAELQLTRSVFSLSAPFAG